MFSFNQMNKLETNLTIFMYIFISSFYLKVTNEIICHIIKYATLI